MFLSRFPAEILSRLSEQLIFTDFVLLHACGDSILNVKLKTAPISVRVLTIRCLTYYNLGVTSRFENIVRVFHRTPDASGDIRHIPKTTKQVITKYYVKCPIPQSVDELIARQICDDVVFERAPGELEVEVSLIFPEIATFNHKYITRVRGQLKHVPTLTNLKIMYLPIDHKLERIPNVEFKYEDQCSHHPQVVKTNPSNSWDMRKCKICGVCTEVYTRKGHWCETIPPCWKLSITRTDILKLILLAISPGVEFVNIRASPAEINEICDRDWLDLIPTSVKRVCLDVLILEYSPNPTKISGLKKIYPFTVCLKTNLEPFICNVQIENLAGIDEFNWKLFREEKMKEMLARNPRISSVWN